VTDEADQRRGALVDRPGKSRVLVLVLEKALERVRLLVDLLREDLARRASVVLRSARQ
jgi:hypothetical protein